MSSIQSITPIEDGQTANAPAVTDVLHDISDNGGVNVHVEVPSRDENVDDKPAANDNDVCVSDALKMQTANALTEGKVPSPHDTKTEGDSAPTELG
jgi:hypothetical protein